MKHTNVQMQFHIDETRTTCAEVRTWNGKWTADAHVAPQSVGDEFDNSDDARRALVQSLRKLADAVERDA